ncbi:MAG: imidazole glycerol phosphate synthase subunit HisH [Bacteroidales bacterium]
MKVVIVKYNAGNILSVQYALRRLGLEAEVSDDHSLIKSADKVIFPGVGEASTTMSFLREKKLDILLQELTQPVLGICLGLQLMCSHSEEGDTECIDLFDVKVKKFPPGDKVPHMGWNAIKGLTGKLFKGVSPDSYVYFVHSYYAELNEITSARCEYILPFSAAFEYNNYFATQFHPEKSGETGQIILKNFLAI